jgi:hypothetical protein
MTPAYAIGDDTEAADVGALLDGLVDRHGLSFVLATLAALCETRAGRIEERWQDNGYARRGSKAANRLDGVATSLGLDGLI